MMGGSALSVPKGWSLVPVGDLLVFKNGLNKGKAYFGYGTPIVNYMDVFGHSGLYSSNVKGLVDVTNAEKKAFSVRKGDVLFTRTSETPEEVGISSVLMNEIEDAVFSGFVLRGRPVSQRLCANYAQYCFSSSAVRGQIVSSATYTTRALTNGRILSKVLLPLPDDPKEQEAIAEALSDADALIEGLERLIAKKRLIKQGAMQDLLTAKRRLPGFSGEWVNKKLGEFGKFKNGINKPTEAFGSGYPFVNLADVFGVTSIQTSTGLGLVETTSVERKVYDVRSGDVLFIRSSVKPSGVGLTALVENDLQDAVFSGFILRFRDSQHLAKSFKRHCFYEASFRASVIAASTVSANTNVNQTALRALEISFPTDQREQEAIGTALSDMDAEIQALETRLEKARQVKEGMMQNLLTGRIRLV